MNEVTIVLHSDRHADPEVHVFAEQDQAIDWANERLKECDRFNDAKVEPAVAKRAGWLFFGTYGEDGSIRVEAKVVR